MELENNKSNHVKTTIALTSTLALLGAGVGTSQQVKADEVTSNDSRAKVTSDESVKMPSTAEGANAALAASQHILETQKAELQTVTGNIDKTKEVITATEAQAEKDEAAVANAKKVLADVSAVSQKEFTDAVAKNKENLASTNAKLVQAQADQAAAQKALANQEAIVTAANNEAKKLAEQALAADKKLSGVKAVINQPDLVSSKAKEAKNNLKTTSVALVKAEGELAKARENSKVQLTKELTSHQTALKTKQAELAKLQSSSKVAVNVVGQNVMKAPAGYPINEIKKLISSSYIGSPTYMSTFNSLRNVIIQKSQQGAMMNRYVDIAKDLNRFVNPDKLTPEVQHELAVFASEMINSVRRQFGLSSVIVTEGSQEFARILTTAYKSTHGNSRPFFNYGQPGVAGHYGIGPHDKTIIENSAKKVGLIPNDDNMYEDLGFFNDVHTVNGIKRSIFNSLRYMFFTDYEDGNILGHTVNLLRSDKRNPKASIYLGFSTSTVGGLNTHFVLFPETNIANHSRFSKKLVSAPTSAANNSTQINSLKNSISTINTKISSLKTRLAHLSSESGVVSAQNKVKSLQGQVQHAMNESAKYEAQLKKLSLSKPKLQKELSEAQAQADVIKAKLDASLAHLSSSKVTLRNLQKKLTVSTSKVSTLVNKKKELEKLINLKLDPNGKRMAEAKLKTTKHNLATVNAKLNEHRATLIKLMDKKADLVASMKVTNQQITLLKNSVKAFAAASKKSAPSEKPMPRALRVSDREPAGLIAPAANHSNLESTHFASPATSVKSEVKNPMALTTIEPKSLKAAKAPKELASKLEAKTNEVLLNSANLITGTSTALAKQLATVAPQVMTGQGVLSKVVSEVSKSNGSTQYGAGSTTAGNISTVHDESTKRAVRAGVVMLAAVGLTGYKLKKDSE
ncbi:SEC10/PgrA surface exclusion domain-containing protein [Streptococcus catagoni]|uniref:SEC10/PgrA surface exclusion domain-containing protein n=1 Tax=Streptococcus catagoni TaxID=2654874 RepID=UPI00140CD15B|nr:SEC10/PgrA surface exclusion domain-containing protein [Streptococcus catagoni]